jgi:hypothetical protein
MCPFCFATVGLVVAGTVSTGGLTALAVKVSRKKNQEAETTSNAKERSNENVNPHSR